MAYEKYTHVLELIDKISIEKDADEINKQFNEIVVYFCDNWTAPISRMNSQEEEMYGYVFSDAEKVAAKECDNLMNTEEQNLQENIRALPPHYSELVFPVAVFKYLLRDLHLPVSHRRIPAFSEFHLRYSRLIMHRKIP